MAEAGKVKLSAFAGRRVRPNPGASWPRPTRQFSFETSWGKEGRNDKDEAPKPWFTLADGRLEQHLPGPLDPDAWIRENPPRVASFVASLLDMRWRLHQPGPLREEQGLINYLNLFVNIQVRSGRYQELYDKWVGGAAPGLTIDGVYR